MPDRLAPSPIRALHIGALLIVPLLIAGCGDAEPEVPPGPPVVTEQVPELSTGELMGLDRERVLATLPWRNGLLTRSAAPSAAVATQSGVDALTGDGFDRLVLNFVRGTAAPGYRIWSPGDQTARVCGEERTFEQSGVIVQLQPATARAEDGTMRIPEESYQLDLPVVAGAELVCESAREVTWFIRTVPERVDVRVLHLGSPDRIALDVRPAAETGAVTTTDVAADTAASGSDS